MLAKDERDDLLLRILQAEVTAGLLGARLRAGVTRAELARRTGVAGGGQPAVGDGGG